MMKFETFKKIIDEGAPKGLRAINLNNFGESFYNKNLVKMIAYAKSKGVLDVMLHTNGTVMENGVRWGQNLALVKSLGGICEPFNHSRKIVEFDTFIGLQSSSPLDGQADIASVMLF